MSENDDAIERLSKKLYSPKNDFSLKRANLYGSGEEAPVGWKTEEPVVDMKRKPSMKPLEMLFAGSIVFFVIALVVSALLFFGGTNTVSTKNVEVKISGPTEIGAGSTASLQIIVTNRNAVPMELTDLIVEFPEGTRSDADISRDLPRIRESIGTIKPGESVNRTVRAVLFGLSGSIASIKASAEYRIPSSNAVFVADSVYAVTINESPASITVSALKEAISGQETSFTVTVSSNAPETLSDVLLVASYPPGFSFKSSSPAPAEGGRVWDLGDIEPGKERTVTVTGSFSGEDGESKVVHFSAGNKKPGDDTAIAAPLALADVALTLQKPFFSVEVSLGGTSGSTYAISRGQVINGTVRWTNNLPTRVQNVAVTLSLVGAILNKSSVKVQNGFYNSNTSVISWDRSTVSEFADVAPGQSGEQTFTFSALPAQQGTFRNADIVLTANVRANRLGEESVPEVIESTSVVKASVLSDVGFAAALTSAGGVMPPKVGVESKYMVTWNITNAGNTLANTLVTGTLPIYATFLSSASSAVSYEETSRTVTWNLGDVAVGQPQTASFLIGITPSVSQVGSSPVMLKGQQVVALDRYVRRDIEARAPDLTTSSASASHGAGNVVP